MKALPHGYTRLYIADVSCLSNRALYAHLYASLPEFRRAAADRYRFECDRRLSVGAWALLQYALCEAGTDMNSLTFAVAEGGKPYIVGHPGVCFSLSHAGKRVAVALADTAVGCDTEVIGAGRLSVAKRWFTDGENALLDSLPSDGEKALLFCRLWVLKESFLKVTGRGLSLSMRDFSFSLTDGHADPILTQHEDKHAYSCREYALDGYRLAVIRREGGCPDGIIPVNLAEL